MECRDVRELADSFLSEQLLVETNHEVVRHLETCRDCRAEMTARRTLREKLRTAFAGTDELRPRPEFAGELTARLRLSPDRVSRRAVMQSWWALAAGLVLAAGGGLVVRESRSRSRVSLLAQVAAADHQNCAIKFNLAERPIPLEEAGRRYGAPYTALATFAVPEGDEPVETLERHSCVYDGRRFGHIVLRYRGAVTSLLVTEGRPRSAPELEQHDRPPAVASLPAGEFLGFVVADLQDAEVLRLAQQLAQPLSRHLTS
jgi:hypothetical protein